MIEIKDLNVSYLGQEKKKSIISNFSIIIPSSSICVIIGSSGIGKTTLLKAVAGLMKGMTGQIMLCGEKIDCLKHNIVYVPQGFGLFPWMTVKENIVCSLKIKKKDKDYTTGLEDILVLLEIKGLEDRYVSELSGGQQQRVSLARAFLLGADLLLMDEPFSALDVITREKMQKVFLDLWKKHKMQTLFVTHSVDEAMLLGEKILVFKQKEFGSYALLDNPFFGQRKAREKTDYQLMATNIRKQLI